MKQENFELKQEAKKYLLSSLIKDNYVLNLTTNIKCEFSNSSKFLTLKSYHVVFKDTFYYTILINVETLTITSIDGKNISYTTIRIINEILDKVKKVVK